MDQKQEKNMILHDDRPQNKNSTNLCPQNQNSKDILVGYNWEIRICYNTHFYLGVYIQYVPSSLYCFEFSTFCIENSSHYGLKSKSNELIATQSLKNVRFVVIDFHILLAQRFP